MPFLCCCSKELPQCPLGKSLDALAQDLPERASQLPGTETPHETNLRIRRGRNGRPMKSRYLKTRVDGKDISTHRHVMEQHLGRKLLTDELVHHKNGNRHDNRIEDLEVTTHKTHSQRHNQRYPRTKVCEVCGK